MKTPDDFLKFAKSVKNRPDLRPSWLKRAVDEPDSTAHYYRFLYELFKELRPGAVLECGTRHGHSAVHMASGYAAANVVTIDMDPKSKEKVAAFPTPNVVALTGNTLALFDEVKSRMPAIDVLFLDSDHTYEVAFGEYRLYRPLVRDGGLILMDDVRINPGLERAWAQIVDPKVEAPFLHWMSFGIAVKDASRSL